MLKILQARLQQYVIRELPDVQAGFRKDRGNRCQIAISHKQRSMIISNLLFVLIYKIQDCPYLQSVI